MRFMLKGLLVKKLSSGTYYPVGVRTSEGARGHCVDAVILLANSEDKLDKDELATFEMCVRDSGGKVVFLGDLMKKVV